LHLLARALPDRLIERDGRVIGCNLPIGNGPLLLRQIDRRAPREPGDDDE
jgi:hypothetical protein